MHSAFFPLFFISLIGVALSGRFQQTEGLLQWFSLVAGLAPLSLYHLALFRKRLLTPTEIDSVYYFGFLVTVVTLVSTAISLGLATTTPNLRWILLQFGLGLVATGYALFARLHLISKSTSTAEGDVVNSTEKLAKNVERVAGEFDKAAFQVAAFVEQTERRLTQLVDQTSNSFSDLEHRTASKFASAEAKFEQRMVEAQNAFNQALAKSASLALERAAGVIDQATKNFSSAISAVMEEIIRIQSEAEGISFSKASERITQFSTEMELSITSISTATNEAVKAGASSVAELAATFNKTARLATEITKKLDSLDRLNELIASIQNASVAISGIAKTSVEAESALSSLAVKTALAEQGIREGVIVPLENTSFAKVLGDVESRLSTAGQLMSDHLISMQHSVLPVAEKMVALVANVESAVASAKTIESGSKGLEESMREFEGSVRTAAQIIATTGETAGSIKSFDAEIHAASSRLADSVGKLGEQADALSLMLGKATPGLDRALSTAASGLESIDKRLSALDELASSARMASQQMRSVAFSATMNLHAISPVAAVLPKPTETVEFKPAG